MASSADALRWFEFLFPERVGADGVPYVLNPPDILELRWTVFDRRARRTIAFGSTAGDAVVGAINSLRTEQDSLIGYVAPSAL